MTAPARRRPLVALPVRRGTRVRSAVLLFAVLAVVAASLALAFGAAAFLVWAKLQAATR